jgi:hypothetical protein
MYALVFYYYVANDPKTWWLKTEVIIFFVYESLICQGSVRVVHLCPTQREDFTGRIHFQDDAPTWLSSW